MAIIKKYSPFTNLGNYKTFLTDDQPSSEFFRISEFKETFTGGKNGFLIEGSEYLKETTEIKIEVLDVEGNPMYFEPGSGIPEYYEGTSILVSVHVYNDTPIGIGQITILGEAKTYYTENGSQNVPNEWKGIYNVKWQKKFKVNKLLSNEDTVRFYKRPLISITELVKPIFSLDIPSIVQTGTVIGIPQTPDVDTDLTNWTMGASYKLKIDDTSRWTGSVVNSVITIDTPIPYTPTILEVLNDTDILVDIPYTVNNIVKSFNSTSYTVPFENTENQIIQESSLTGSWAQIKMSNLKTFVGDVARVKVFRKSRNEVGDYQFTQETKLESTELLRDLATQVDTQISYGNFTQDSLYNYWISSSNDHPISINTDTLLNSLKVDYNEISGGIQRLETVDSLDISSAVEYTLSFKTLLSGSIDSSKYIKAYLSSSTYTQDILQINAINDYKQRTVISDNIIATTSSLAKLVFEIYGSDWYISNASLRNSQETSFSPDEFIFVQDVPRKLPAETFDYRFEFYDINNNYIPVDVNATKEFNGGNLTTTFSDTAAFTFTTPIPYFRFASGSIGNPIKQTIPFSVTRNIITGSITYASSALDENGVWIDPNLYTGAYPGRLTNATDFGASLLIGDFTGSDPSYTIGTMIYTASLGTLQRYQRVDRIQEGLSTSELFASANTNQFYYSAADLSGTPNTQEISISVKRKNLSTIISEITAVSESGAPPLTVFSDLNGTKTYKISVNDYPYTAGAITYQFTGSDQFNLLYSDETTITPLINYSGITVNVTNESTTFQATSDGIVTSIEYDRGDGEASVLVGSTSVSFLKGLGTNNTFEILLVTGSSGVTVNESYPATNSYGISDMTNDQGSIVLTIQYKDGSGTISTFTKNVGYSKIRASISTAAPRITPQAQVISATSAGTLTGTIEDPTLTILEGTTPYSYNQTTSSLGNGEYKITNVTGVTVANTEPTSSTIDVTAISADTNFGDVSYIYKSTTGLEFSGSIIFSIAKAKDGNGATVTLPVGLVSGSDQVTGSLDDHYVTLLTDQDISGSKTFDTGDNKNRIIVRNSGTGDGINIQNDALGQGIWLDNNSAGVGLYATNKSTNSGIFIQNQSTGTGQTIQNIVTGDGLTVINTSFGKGINMINSDGTGIYMSNSTSGVGVDILDYSSGDSIRVNAIGVGSSGYVLNIQDDGVKKFSIDKSGNVSGSSYVKSGATSDDVLLGDGTTTSLSSIAGATSGNYNFAGDIFNSDNSSIYINGLTGTITATTLNVTNITGTAFANLKATKGWQKLGGGTIIQWGYGIGTDTVSFALAFPSFCRYVGVTTNRSSSGSRGFNHAYNVTKYGFIAVPDGSEFWWFAVGY